MRIYAITVGVSPMKAYVTTDYGLTKCCASDYSLDFSDTSCQITNKSLNKNHPNFVDDTNAYMDGDLLFSNCMHVSTGWKFIQRDYPEANIEEMKEKIVHAIKYSLRALRPTVEMHLAEQFDIQNHPDVNDRIYQIYGYDVMFDTNYNVHLFEANRRPIMVPYIVKTGENGETIKSRSPPDELNIKTILSEALRIMVMNQEPKIAKKVYDSSQGDDADFLYEKVVKVFRILSGKPLRSMLTCEMIYDSFTSLSTPTLDLSKVDIESIFAKVPSLKGYSATPLSVYDLFKFMRYVADELDMTLYDTLSEI